MHYKCSVFLLRTEASLVRKSYRGKFGSKILPQAGYSCFSFRFFFQLPRTNGVTEPYVPRTNLSPNLTVSRPTLHNLRNCNSIVKRTHKS